MYTITNAKWRNPTTKPTGKNVLRYAILNKYGRLLGWCCAMLLCCVHNEEKKTMYGCLGWMSIMNLRGDRTRKVAFLMSFFFLLFSRKSIDYVSDWNSSIFWSMLPFLWNYFRKEILLLGNCCIMASICWNEMKRMLYVLMIGWKGRWDDAMAEIFAWVEKQMLIRFFWSAVLEFFQKGILAIRKGVGWIWGLFLDR